MRASKFTDAQKAFIIKQGEARIPVAEICRKLQDFHLEAAAFHSSVCNANNSSEGQ